MHNLTVTLPHRLGRIEARRRIENGIREVRQQYGHFFSQLDERWEGDTLSFLIKAVGQRVSGQIFVQESEVRIEVELPWMLALLGGVVRQQVEQQGRRWLGNQPAANPS